ncbi:MAG: Ig-like domain-containing protein [Oligosphaeraceae bacterium]
MIIDGITGINESDQSIKGESNFVASAPDAITIEVKKGFNFATKDGATFSTDEDKDLTVCAADANAFAATIWDTDKLVPTTDVAFKTAELDNTAAATVKVENGQIVLTPNKAHLDEQATDVTVTVTYGAVPSANPDATPETGTFQVTIKAIDDLPTLTDPSFKPIDPYDHNVTYFTENKAGTLAFDLTLTDCDTKASDYALEVWLGEEKLGTMTSNADNTFSFEKTDLTFDFDTVAHPNTKTTLTATVKAMLNGKELATKDFTITVKDEDREPNQPTLSIDKTTAYTDENITASLDLTNVEDPDGDEITSSGYTWKCGETELAGAILPEGKTTKGQTWTCRGYINTWPYGEDGEDSITVSTYSSTLSVTILNSVPVADSKSLFIRKHDAGDGKGTVTLTATDKDDDTITFSIVTNGSKGTASLEGSTLTYQVTDLNNEFYGENADVITLKANDGEADSAEFTVTVTYRENPPADITVDADAPATIDEVTADGTASTFTATITATDSTEVTPAGIKSIEWSILKDGAAVSGWTLAPSTTNATDLSKTETCTVTLPGYDTIVNDADGTRPQNATFQLKVVVTDALDATTEKTWDITVNDVDRAPTAPTTVEVQYAGAKVTELKVSETPETFADGATDPDGDAVAYDFAWSCGDKTDIANRLKDETWTLTATATTAPYGVKVVSESSASATFTVINTAPVLAAQKTQPWADAPVLESTAKTAAISAFVAVADDDQADTDAGFDYTFAVKEDSAVKGTFTIDGDNVTFEPEAHQVGTVTFTVTATERTASKANSNTVDLSFEVIGVNSAPFFKPADQYLTPQDCTGEARTVSFDVTMGDSDDEASQELDASRVTVTKTDPDGIISGEPTIAIADHTITITYTVPTDAADKMGKSAIFQVTLADNGGTANGGSDSATYDFKVVLGATPWYPIVEVASDDIPEGVSAFLIDATDEAGKVLFTMRGLAGTILPVDYLDYTDGLLPGTYTYKFYPWSAADGRADEPAFEKTVDIAEYTAPADGAVEATVNGNTVTFKLSAPLAQGYTMTIRKDGADVQTIAKRFTEATDGMLLPETEFKLDFYEAGIYTVDLQGYNPQGEGSVATEVATFTIDDDDDSDVFFDGLNGFSPASGKAIVTESDATTVTFTWPALKAGYTYQLEIFDRNGQLAVAFNAGTATEATVKLASKDNATSYLWRVVVTNSTARVVSASLNLQLVKKSDAPIISGAYVDSTNDGNVLRLAVADVSSLDGIAYDVMYYNTATAEWTMCANVVPVQAENGLILELGFEPNAGDGIYIRAKKNGKAIGTYTPYVLVSSN